MNPPWNESNLKEWLYRRVKVTGRPIHKDTMFVPIHDLSFSLHGYEYLVPLVTREDSEGLNQEGFLLAKGFIPYLYREANARYKMEDVNEQTFIAYVTQLPELAEHDLLSKGNSPGLGRNKWSHVDLKDMAQTANLKNKKTVQLAALECVDDQTPLDERDMHI